MISSMDGHRHFSSLAPDCYVSKRPSVLRNQGHHSRNPELHDLNEFFRLSAILNLQLSATAVGRSNIVSVIYGRREIKETDHKLMLMVLEYLGHAYAESRRRLGSLAVLHPLRATAILARAVEKPSLLDLMTEMLHDKLEDLTSTAMEPELWEQSEAQFKELLKTVDPDDEWFLMERLTWLTRLEEDTYFTYIGRLLEKADRTPSLVAVKLADRLDNTLDMRIDIEDPIEGVDFFSAMFQVSFANTYQGYVPEIPHPPPSPLNGAQRLYQLFKNAVLLSMIRKRRLDNLDDAVTELFDALAVASMKEAQRTVLHIFGYHLTDVRKQRELIQSAMEYVQKGGIERVTLPNHDQRLDGLFETTFEHSDRKIRTAELTKLYADKELMVLSSIAFIVIFLSFRNDPDFCISDLEQEGTFGMKIADDPK
jgi:hypothetical protein